MQLSTGHAFESLEYFQQLEQLITGISNFYNNKGHKRKEHLKETADALVETCYEFSALFKIRWLAAEFSALANIQKVYIYIGDKLSHRIVAENWAGATTKAQAQGVIRFQTDKTIKEFMHLMFAILNNLAYL